MTETKETPNYEFSYVSEIEQWLGVSDIREYPEGVRAAVRKILLEKVPGGNWSSRELRHLLFSIKTDGFSSIPGSILQQTHNVADITPNSLLGDVMQQVEWQRGVIAWLLDELEGKHPPLGERNDA